jgi:hypothetical protein
MTDAIITIPIALHQSVVACNIRRLRMTPYGTFEIHTCKEPAINYTKQQPLRPTNHIEPLSLQGKFFTRTTLRIIEAQLSNYIGK